MKPTFKTSLSRLRASIAFILCMFAASSSAQYYEIANQLPSLIQPALSGSFRYKGYLDFTGTAGMGTNRANFVGISTTQGFQYADWFFMGAGLGVDLAIAPDPNGDFINDNPWQHIRASQKRVMIPVFSDFRFIIGSQSVGCFIDLKVGSTWLIGNRYLELKEGYLSTAAQFLFRPSLGIRIPIRSSNPKQAFSIGVTYQLITSSNNYGWFDRGNTLNSLGFNVGFEW